MCGKRRNSGFALLMLLVVLLGMTTLAFSNILSNSVKQKEEKKRITNREALLEAKEALLAYSIDFLRDNSLVGMGRLPCPDSRDTNDPGAQDSPCGSVGVNAVGYLPYRMLGLSRIEDASGTCLWYAVSGTYKNEAAYDLVNRDTPGYLTLENENEMLLHGDSKNDYPVALIIAPGANLGGDRSIDTATAGCKGSYDVAAYLEGGDHIDITDDHPADPYAFWPFLGVSNGVDLKGEAYNDRVIAIYRDEIWNRIERLKQLDFDNTTKTAAGGAPVSAVEKLTESLAQCLVAFGNANTSRKLPFAAPVDLVLDNDDEDEYRDEALYDDENDLHHGRFPQVLSLGTSPSGQEEKFVLDSAGDSYCESVLNVSFGPFVYEEQFWDNWKDHFFYLVSEDFDNDTGTANTARCVSDCISIDDGAGGVKVAAVVLFAGKAEPGVSRLWWWDEANNEAPVDDKADMANYLEGDFGTDEYTGGEETYTLTATDYAYCVQYDNVAETFSATKCADLIP